MPVNPQQRPPTLDYQTPEATTWRLNWASILVNTFSIAFYALVILSFFAVAVRYAGF